MLRDREYAQLEGKGSTHDEPFEAQGDALDKQAPLTSLGEVRTGGEE